MSGETLQLVGSVETDISYVGWVHTLVFIIVLSCFPWTFGLTAVSTSNEACDHEAYSQLFHVICFLFTCLVRLCASKDFWQSSIVLFKLSPSRKMFASLESAPVEDDAGSVETKGLAEGGIFGPVEAVLTSIELQPSICSLHPHFVLFIQKTSEVRSSLGQRQEALPNAISNL